MLFVRNNIISFIAMATYNQGPNYHLLLLSHCGTCHVTLVPGQVNQVAGHVSHSLSRPERHPGSKMPLSCGYTMSTTAQNNGDKEKGR